MENKKSTTLTTLSETLFIPLSVRANETASRAAVIKDTKAVEIINKVSTEGIITDGGSILVRTGASNSLKSLHWTAPG